MIRIVTGHQPVYLPWLGLFHKIALSDVYVYMDDVQYLRKDWNNRNRILGPHGAFWLTVPVDLKHSATMNLKDIRLCRNGDPRDKGGWQYEHWKSIQCSYRKCAYWSVYSPFLEAVYMQRIWHGLSDLNEYMLRYFLEQLDIKVDIIKAAEHGFEGRKSDLVLDHCCELGAEVCVLGEQGRNYLNEADFVQQGIHVYYQSYNHPRYTQRYKGFTSHLSVVDLLFNKGPESREILLKDNVSREQLRTCAEKSSAAAVLHI
jgi:hypothetical protein